MSRAFRNDTRRQRNDEPNMGASTSIILKLKSGRVTEWHLLSFPGRDSSKAAVSSHNHIIQFELNVPHKSIRRFVAVYRKKERKKKSQKSWLRRTHALYYLNVFSPPRNARVARGLTKLL